MPDTFECDAESDRVECDERPFTQSYLLKCLAPGTKPIWQGLCTQRSTVMRWRLTLGLAVVAFLLSTSSARAGVLDASWTVPTVNVDGTPLTDLGSFRIYYSNGSTPCPGPSVFQMSSSTS